MSDQDTSFQPASASGKIARLHYIDWLRVIAIMMVFLVHSVHVFDRGGWHIKNIEQSETLTILLYFLMMWGMPFFFLIAGAGSWFALHRRSARGYASERFKRLLIPFFAGLILFTPIVLFLQWRLITIRGVIQESYLAWLSHFIPFGFTPQLFGWGLHLWFLGFLFCFAIFTLPLCLWLKGERGKKFLGWLAHACEKRGGILLFILPLLVIQLSLRPFFPAEHDWTDFFFQMAFFVLGFILFSDQRFSAAIRRDWSLILGLGCLAFLTLLGMYAVGLPVETWYATTGSPGFFLVYTFITVIALTWCLFMLYIGMRFLDFSNAWLSYWSEAALPFFVIHQPVIIVIAFFVVQWELFWPIKMLIVVLGSFFVCLGLYELVIRRTRPLRLAFGMQARARPKAA
jgi:glucan biosynthesis protein C